VALLGLLGTTVLFLLLGDIVIASLLGWSLPGRVLVTIAIIAPFGFALGGFFPLGLAAVQRRNRNLIPWAWSINSGFTVIGSVLAIALAMWLGFFAVILVALLVYCVGSLAFLRYLRVPEAVD
jgi:hypothetical protein